MPPVRRRSGWQDLPGIYCLRGLSGFAAIAKVVPKLGHWLVARRSSVAKILNLLLTTTRLVCTLRKCDPLDAAIVSRQGFVRGRMGG